MIFFWQRDQLRGELLQSMLKLNQLFLTCLNFW